MSYRTIGSLLLRRLSASHAPLPKPQHGEAADVGQHKEMVYEMHKIPSILAIGFLFGALARNRLSRKTRLPSLVTQ